MNQFAENICVSPEGIVSIITLTDCGGLEGGGGVTGPLQRSGYLSVDWSVYSVLFPSLSELAQMINQLGRVKSSEIK